MLSWGVCAFSMYLCLAGSLCGTPGNGILAVRVLEMREGRVPMGQGAGTLRRELLSLPALPPKQPPCQPQTAFFEGYSLLRSFCLWLMCRLRSASVGAKRVPPGLSTRTSQQMKRQTLAHKCARSVFLFAAWLNCNNSNSLAG